MSNKHYEQYIVLSKILLTRKKKRVTQTFRGHQCGVRVTSLGFIKLHRCMTLYNLRTPRLSLD